MAAVSLAWMPPPPQRHLSIRHTTTQPSTMATVAMVTKAITTAVIMVTTVDIELSSILGLNVAYRLRGLNK